MRSLQDEIKQAQRDLSCPICSRTFEVKDICVRSYVDETTIELSVICDRGHFPVILLVPVTLKELAKVGPITKKELLVVSKKIDQLQESLTSFYTKKDKNVE